MVRDILSSGLGSIWYCMTWFCRYLEGFGYSVTIIGPAYHILNCDRHAIGPQLSCQYGLTVYLALHIREKSHKIHISMEN